MFKVINIIIDRCFFTLSFIVGVQLPEFINQYTQRLSGHLNEASLQLTKFQRLADQHYQGDLILLVKRYQANSDPVIVETATIIEQLLLRIEMLEHQLAMLIENNYFDKLQYFFINLEPSLAKATAQQFTLAIPLEINALTTGGLLAILLLFIKAFITFAMKKLSRSLWPTQIENN